jgi:tripartite-type tricarboxylate transporter receptor subunit TctC
MPWHINALRGRHAVLMAAATIGLATATAEAAGQSTYPARPVRVIVPFPPAGAVDVVARPLTQRLSERSGQQFYIENIPGASGNIGTSRAAKAAADGYTILITFSTYVVNPSLHKTLPYDPYTDLDAVTLVATTPTALVVNPSVPATTVRTMVDLIRANPGAYTFAHGGTGTQGHLAGEQFRMKLSLDIAPVAFVGGGQAVLSVLGGHTPIGFIALGPVASNVKEGLLRALALTGETRSQILPDVPTLAEAGYPDIAGESWVGVLVPAGTPTDITAFLYRQIAELVGEPEMKERLGALGYEPVGSTPDAFAARIRSEIPAWATVIQTIKVQ